MPLLLKDFVLDDATGIRLPPAELPPAGYLDGAERRLLEALPGVADRSVGSPELQALIDDWPTLYHLMPYRATIFDCFGFTGAAGARVLEPSRPPGGVAAVPVESRAAAPSAGSGGFGNDQIDRDDQLLLTDLHGGHPDAGLDMPVRLRELESCLASRSRCADP